MKIAIKRVGVLSAFKFGLVYSPIMFTVNRFVLSGGGFGISFGEYISGVVGALVSGAILAAAGAFVYNLLAARFGPLKLEIDVQDES